MAIRDHLRVLSACLVLGSPTGGLIAQPLRSNLRRLAVSAEPIVGPFGDRLFKVCTDALRRPLSAPAETEILSACTEITVEVLRGPRAAARYAPRYRIIASADRVDSVLSVETMQPGFSSFALASARRSILDYCKPDSSSDCWQIAIRAMAIARGISLEKGRDCTTLTESLLHKPELLPTCQEQVAAYRAALDQPKTDWFATVPWSKDSAVWLEGYRLARFYLHPGDLTFSSGHNNLGLELHRGWLDTPRDSSEAPFELRWRVSRPAPVLVNEPLIVPRPDHGFAHPRWALRPGAAVRDDTISGRPDPSVPTPPAAEIFEREFLKLSQGRARPVVPTEMQAGIADTVVLRIAKDTLAFRDAQSGTVYSAPVTIKVSTLMEATLEGENFKVVSLVPGGSQIRQLVSAGDTTTQWVWLVTPLRSGKQMLRMNARVVVWLPGSEQSRTFTVMATRVPVSINFSYATAELVSLYWAQVSGAIAMLSTAAGILWGWKKRKASPKPSLIVRPP
jgi:hypothetical protein